VFGCNELSAQTLCCAPTPTCGNGVVDGVEEECDDGNFDETDDCLNSCSWRVPTAHGIAGVGCL
jgi:cysteine-rich repeat protein